MQVSQRWRIWLGVCVTVTVPLLGRDFYQIATNPPVLNARLPSSPPTLADSCDVAFLGSNLSAQLVEVRVPVAGGYAGWEPRAETLTGIAPSDPVSPER